MTRYDVEQLVKEDADRLKVAVLIDLVDRQTPKDFVRDKYGTYCCPKCGWKELGKSFCRIEHLTSLNMQYCPRCGQLVNT